MSCSDMTDFLFLFSHNSSCVNRDINTKLVMSMLIKLFALVIQFIICKSTSELLVISYF